MNRKAQYAPTLYHPVLGQQGSYREKGEKTTFQFRYVLQDQGWCEILHHVAYDIYDFAEGLALRQNRISLTDRLLAMHDYVMDDQTSMWRVE